MLAISPDSPAEQAETAEEHSLRFPLLSDPDLAAIKAFGIGFQKGEQRLPVPSIYIVNKKGKIRFQYVNPNFRVRPPNELILAAVRPAGSR